MVSSYIIALINSGRSKKHFPVSATALLGRRDAENVKSFGQSRNGFVGRKDPFPVGDQARGNSFKIVAHAVANAIFELMAKRGWRNAFRAPAERSSLPIAAGRNAAVEIA